MIQPLTGGFSVIFIHDRPKQAKQDIIFCQYHTPLIVMLEYKDLIYSTLVN